MLHTILTGLSDALTVVNLLLICLGVFTGSADDPESFAIQGIQRPTEIHDPGHRKMHICSG